MESIDVKYDIYVPHNFSPRFALFFVRRARQKSKPRLIRFFPVRLIKWHHLPSRRVGTGSQG